MGDRVVTRAIFVAGWVVIALAVVGLEVRARTKRDVPTIAAVLRRLAGRPALRVVLVMVWLWAGWHFFVRSSR